ncbi:MAG: hypothetical protein D6773_00635 [Alphaproteobacteria bacterium]|nr:MAG: hypothetical protein D6773_00635 [Alphaproteobacteria bacterium]
MRHPYSAFGLTLVCDRPLPHHDPDYELDRTGETERVEISLAPWSVADCRRARRQSRQLYRSRSVDGDGNHLLTIARRAPDHALCLFFGDGATFFVAPDGAWVEARWHAPSNLEDAATYLLGVVLGLVLRLRGVITLHASAVVIEGQAVALAGDQGAGKSTTAAAFAQRGFSVLSDDMTVLRESPRGFLVEPDFAILKLWPNASELLLGDADLLPNLSATWDKRYLKLRTFGLPAAERSQPLRAVYLLDPQPDSIDRIEIEDLRRLDALIALLANTYGLVNFDRQMQALELDVLARLVPAVPIRRLRRPAQGFGPERVVEAILTNLTGLDRRPIELAS